MSEDLELVERVIKLASTTIRKDSSFMRMCELAKHAAEADIENERLRAEVAAAMSNADAAFAAAKQRLRAEALEEAALECGPKPGEAWTVEERAIGEHIAAVIRALIKEEK